MSKSDSDYGGPRGQHLEIRVPADQVDQAVQKFRDNGAIQVDYKDNGDGTFLITVTLPHGD